MAVKDIVDNTFNVVGSNLPGPFAKTKPAEDTRRQSCEAQGGVWDAVNEVCVRKEQPLNEIQQPEKPKDTSSITVKSGSKDIVLKAGESFEGVGGTISYPGRDIEGARSAEISRMNEARIGAGLEPLTPEEAPITTLEKIKQKEIQAQQTQQALGQLGQIGELTQATEAPINWSQALTAGVANIIPSLIGGASLGVAGKLAGRGIAAGAAGAAAGTAAAPLVGAGVIALGAAGAVSGLFSGVMADIKVQQAGEIGAARVDLTKSVSAMRQLTLMARYDPGNADIYVNQYNEILTRMHQARRQIAAETQGDLNGWIEDGRKDLATADYLINVEAPLYGDKLKIYLGGSDIPNEETAAKDILFLMESLEP